MRWIAETQPQPALAIGLVRGPFEARIDGDARRERGLGKLLGVDDIGQLDPQEDAALGIIELGRGADSIMVSSFARNARVSSGT